MIAGNEIDPSLLKGRDKDDAHVLAAAAHGHVDYLVTANYKDFEEFSEHFEFAIFLSDDMLSLMAERRPDAVLAAIKKQCSYWQTRSGSKTLPAALIDASAPNFAGYVKAQLAGLALSGHC